MCCISIRILTVYRTITHFHLFSVNISLKKVTYCAVYVCMLLCISDVLSSSMGKKSTKINPQTPTETYSTKKRKYVYLIEDSSKISASLKSYLLKDFAEIMSPCLRPPSFLACLLGVCPVHCAGTCVGSFPEYGHRQSLSTDLQNTPPLPLSTYCRVISFIYILLGSMRRQHCN